MIPRRTGTPTRAQTPSIDASYRSQIDDLVQRNRTLEHTIKKLTAELDAERTKAKSSVAALQKQWQAEQQEWHEGCDVLQSCHRIIQSRYVVELEKERSNVLEQVEVSRLERLKRLQRDFRITMFQVRETELEDKIAQIEHHRDRLVDELEEQIQLSEQRAKELASALKEKGGDVDEINKQMEKLESLLSDLQAENAQLQASAESLTSRLERVNLQLEGARTKNADLERVNDELKRSNADIQRQLDKWQSLEKRDGAEVESLRKQRIQLEVKVNELESRLQRQTDEHSSLLDKEKRRVEKLKETVREWREEANRCQTEAEEAEAKIATAEEEIQELRSALEVRKARRPSPSPQQRKKTFRQSEDEVVEAIEIESRTAPTAKKGKPGPKARTPSPITEARESGSEELPQQGNLKKRRKARGIVNNSDVEEVPPPPKRQKKAREAVVEESEQESDEPRKKSKGKAKAKARSPSETVEDEIMETEPPVTQQKKRKARGADKATSLTAKPRSAQSEAMNARKKGKANGRAASIEPQDAADDDDVQATAPKKKKRKINLFPSSQPTAFDFTAEVNNLGLNIPTVLSPIRETEPVPNRSTSGSMILQLGGMLSSFTRRT